LNDAFKKFEIGNTADFTLFPGTDVPEDDNTLEQTVVRATPSSRNMAAAAQQQPPQQPPLSPSSSPRLPSPPPFPEVQIGPQSPALGAVNSIPNAHEERMIDQGAGRRIRPGTKAADMASGPPLIPLSEV
jgi:hypothetical protein